MVIGAIQTFQECKIFYSLQVMDSHTGNIHCCHAIYLAFVQIAIVRNIYILRHIRTKCLIGESFIVDGRIRKICPQHEYNILKTDIVNYIGISHHLFFKIQDSIFRMPSLPIRDLGHIEPRQISQIKTLFIIHPDIQTIAIGLQFS